MTGADLPEKVENRQVGSHSNLYGKMFLGLGVMVFNTTFNNISVLSWQYTCFW
jgi:hypothetical protein